MCNICGNINCSGQTHESNWLTNCTTQNPCAPKPICKEKISAKCDTYTGPDLNALGLNSGTDLEAIIKALDDAATRLKNDVQVCCNKKTTTSTTTTTTIIPNCSLSGFISLLLSTTTTLPPTTSSTTSTTTQVPTTSTTTIIPTTTSTTTIVPTTTTTVEPTTTTTTVEPTTTTTTLPPTTTTTTVEPTTTTTTLPPTTTTTTVEPTTTTTTVEPTTTTTLPPTTTSTTSTTTECQRPSGLLNKVFNNTSGPSGNITDFTATYSSACDAWLASVQSLIDTGSAHSINGVMHQLTSFAVGQTVYNGTLGTLCTFAPDGFYITNFDYATKIAEITNIVSGVIVSITTSCVYTTTSTTTAAPCYAPASNPTDKYTSRAACEAIYGSCDEVSC